MKQIAFLFFTFLGICTGFAQKPDPVIDSVRGKENPAVRLFPNPAKNKVEIGISGFEQGYVQVLLIAKDGSQVRNERRLVFNGNETIVFMFSEKPGMYLLVLKQGKTSIRSGLIIQ